MKALNRNSIGMKPRASSKNHKSSLFQSYKNSLCDDWQQLENKKKKGRLLDLLRMRNLKSSLHFSSGTVGNLEEDSSIGGFCVRPQPIVGWDLPRCSSKFHSKAPSMSRHNPKISVIDMQGEVEPAKIHPDIGREASKELVKRYLLRAKAVQWDRKETPREVSKLFEDLFAELSEEIPLYRSLFKEMKGLAQVLAQESPSPASSAKYTTTTTSTTNRNGTSQRIFPSASGKYILKEKPKELILSCAKLKLVSDTISEKELEASHEQKMKGRNTESILPITSLTDTPAGKRKVVIPPLNLKILSKTGEDYNKEFYSKMDQFSESWRANAEQTRTLYK